MTAQHAKYRPPSSASRWLSCPGSAGIMHLYPNAETEASSKGTLAHSLLDAYLTLGMIPDTDDADMDLNVVEAGQWIKERKQAYGKDCQMYVETRLEIPQTGEFGTADVIFVTPNTIEIVDFKNGYVPVDVYMNAQMMVYLLGAIAKFGERRNYKTTIIQPNYDHVDGTIRSWSPKPEQVEWFEIEVKTAVSDTNFYPGKHCKSTYCEHRGNCASFLDWGQNNAAIAWHPHEVNATTDDELAMALDHADTLHGLRDEMRKAAIVRIMQHGRDIRGYKVVKSRANREFAGDEGRNEAYRALLAMGYEPDQLVDRKPFKVGDTVMFEQSPLSVKGVEDMVKHKFKVFGRGKWKEVFDEYIKPHIREFSGSITLERAIDGRPSVRPGSEFTPLTNETPVTNATNVTII